MGNAEASGAAASRIRVAVTGAAGRMGGAVVAAVSEAADLQLVAAVDTRRAGDDAGTVAGLASLGLPIESDLDQSLNRASAQVLVDFTTPDSAAPNSLTAIRRMVCPVVGTTGISASERDEIDHASRAAGVGAVIAPNFALGAVLMMECAALAARYMPNVEIIELHHERKVDWPSGTAILTAERIGGARSEAGLRPLEMPSAARAIEGARGAISPETHGIPIHSIRLPGYVAHQEVIFGDTGQTLTIRHDSTDRRSFMPGVLLAIRRVTHLRGLTVGLEKLLWPSQ